MTRTTGLDSSGRKKPGMQDGLEAGINQPAVPPSDGTRNGRDPKRLEVTLPPGPLVVQYSAAQVRKKKTSAREHEPVASPVSGP